MQSKYKKGDKLKCSKDFVMNSGALAFKKGEVYEILRVDQYIDEYDYVMHSMIDPFHTMPDEALDKYFELVND